MPNQQFTSRSCGRRCQSIHPLPFLLAIGLLLPVLPAFADDFTLVGEGALSSVPLPTGSESSDLILLDTVPAEIVYLDDGRLLAVRQEGGSGTIVLFEILTDGSSVDLGIVPPPEGVTEWPLDLAVDSLGRLFLLTQYSEMDYYFDRILQLDPEDASILQSHDFIIGFGGPIPRMLARAPDGLWAMTDEGLELYDPEFSTFTLRHPMFSSALDGDVDSTGQLWLWESDESFTKLDPETGNQEAVSAPLNPTSRSVRDIAIRRGCVESDSRLCLQAGRFQVDVTWRDFEGIEGVGRLTSARSVDSGVFWFFHPANWELMVKVLDACGFNDKFWVFSSGSTNVQYELRVTDLESGTVQIYDNPLGRIALTVTDTAAFDCE